MISFYENFHNINKMSAIFVSSALRRGRIVLFSCAPLPYAIRTPRNIHVVTEGEKTTVATVKMIALFVVPSVSFLPLFLVTPTILYDAFNNTALPRGRSRVQY